MGITRKDKLDSGKSEGEISFKLNVITPFSAPDPCGRKAFTLYSIHWDTQNQDFTGWSNLAFFFKVQRKFWCALRKAFVRSWFAYRESVQMSKFDQEVWTEV